MAVTSQVPEESAISRHTVLGILGIAAIAVMVVTFVWYAKVVAIDLPFIDDWLFIDRLMDFVQGRTGFNYFFIPHEAHPMMVDRIAIYLDWRFARLDLSLLRWCSAVIVLATTALLGWRLYSDLREPGPLQWSWGEAIAATAPTCILALSLGQWEIFKAAASIDIAAASALVVLSVFLLDRWRNAGAWGWLAGALVAACFASQTQMHGKLVWPAMALLLLLDPRRATRPFLGLVAVCAVAFVGFGIFNIMELSTQTQFHTQFITDPLQLFLGDLTLSGGPYLGLIDNRPFINGAMLFGVLAWGFTAIAVAAYFRTPADDRRAMDKYLALIAFGIAASLMVVIGRLYIGLDAMTTPRYTAAIAAWGWGIAGLLALAARRDGWVTNAFVVLATVIVIGVGLTSLEEGRIVQYRAANGAEDIAALRNGAILADKAAWHRMLNVNELFDDVVPRVRDFLAANKLSLFRDQP